MADDPTEAIPAVKVAIEPLSRWTVSQFQVRFAQLSQVNTRKTRGVHRGETKVLFDDMCTAIVERDSALQAEVDGGARAKQVAANQRTMLRELTEQIARLRGENPGMGGLPVRAVAEVMGATRQGEHGAELILADARRKAGLVLANADRAQREAEDLLARARENAAVERPTLTLPDAPKVDRDSLAGQAEWVEWIEAARDSLEAHRVELADWEVARQEAIEREERALDAQQRDLDEQEQALAAQRGEVVANLDRIAAEAPLLRERVEAIDLTGETAGEATQAMEVA
jgi:hypothetical protein